MALAAEQILLWYLDCQSSVCIISPTPQTIIHWGLYLFHTHTGVHRDRDRALWTDHERIDVQFLDLRELGDQLGEPLETLGDGLDIHAFLAAHALEHLIRTGI